MADQIIVADVGYKVNFLQIGLVKRLGITLTSSALKIEDIDEGKVLSDVPLEKVKSIKATNVLIAMLAQTTQGANLKIKTDTATYKISWKDVDARKVVFGNAGYDYNALSGYKKAKLWQDTFNSLRSGTEVKPIYNNLKDVGVSPAGHPKKSTRHKTGYAMILVPVLLLAVGSYLVYLAASHPDQVDKYGSYFAFGFLIGIVGLFLLPFGIIFGGRKIR
jgi:hypothetical protein